MSIWQPVSSVIFLITLPPGPMTSRILSGWMCRIVIRGANGDISARGAGSTSRIRPRMNSRPTRACSSAFFMISNEIPPIFVSIWNAVMPSVVPVTLKSMSPR